MRSIDFTDVRKGKLIAISRDPENLGSYWICQCDCGKIVSKKFASTSAISCGCAHKPDEDFYKNQLRDRIKKNSVI